MQIAKFSELKTSNSNLTYEPNVTLTEEKITIKQDKLNSDSMLLLC